MVIFIVVALVIALVVLVMARSAQQDSRALSDQDPMAPPSAAEQTSQRLTEPPAGATDARFQRAAQHDLYLWESRRIAARGEARAGSLDFFGYLVSGIAALVVLGAFLAVVSADEGLSTDGKGVIVAGVCGSVLFLIAIAAIFFGFGALVRNSSRSLSISAGQALDSFEPEG